MNLYLLPAHTRVVFICEKPAQARNVASAWATFRPDLPTTFIFLCSLTGGEMVIPREIRYADLPMTRDPEFRRLPHRPKVGRFSRNAENGHIVSTDTDAAEVLREADLIIGACDPDVRGVGMFRRFLQTQMGIDPAQVELPVVRAFAEDEKSLHQAFYTAVTTRSPDFVADSRASEATQFFYHNWALNALPIFGDVLRALGVTGDTFISKYQMLLLHVLHRKGPLLENQIFRMMQDWEGSGKWSRENYRGFFGSASSRQAILEQLISKGLVEKKAWMKTPHGSRQNLGLSEKGRAFLNITHPDGYDPDIGFRLNDWQRRWPASRTQMERYIHTYFGKMKRYIGRARKD